jgi:superfamily I DNA/RNA helicase
MMVIYEEEKRMNGQCDEISLSDFLSVTLLDQKQEFTHIKKTDDDRVNLSTFHSAKGLEFTACFLVGLEDHIIPHEKSVLDTGLEEERRLLYVAMTRAKEHLCLSMSRHRKKMGKDLTTNPSRFLLEVPKSLVKISSWQTV